MTREFGATLRLAAPMIGAQLLMVSMGFIDTVMAGRMGALQLAAVSMGSAMWVFVFLAANGLIMGISPTIAQLFGAGRRRTIGRRFRQGIWYALVVGALAAVATREVAWLMPLVGVDAEVAPIAREYLHAIAFGMPAMCLYLVPRFLNEAIGNPRPVLFIQMLMLPLGILGNWVFMYGNLGAPAMGAPGAGVASAIGLWISATLMYAYVYLGARFKGLQLFRGFEPLDWRVFNRLLRLGLPISGSMVLEAGLFAAVTLLMGTLGATALAGHQIALNYASLTFMIPLGISMATTVRVGHASGARDAPGVRARGSAGIVLGGAAMTVSATVMLLFPDFIIRIYTDDQAAAEVARGVLFAAALFQVSDGLQVCAAGALRGIKDVNLPLAVNALAYWGIGLPVAWWLGIHGGGHPPGLWLGLVAGLSVAALLLNARFWWLTQLKANQRPT